MEFLIHYHYKQEVSKGRFVTRSGLVLRNGDNVDEVVREFVNSLHYPVDLNYTIVPANTDIAERITLEYQIEELEKILPDIPWKIVTNICKEKLEEWKIRLEDLGGPVTDDEISMAFSNELNKEYESGQLLACEEAR